MSRKGSFTLLSMCTCLWWTICYFTTTAKLIILCEWRREWCLLLDIDTEVIRLHSINNAVRYDIWISTTYMAHLTDYTVTRLATLSTSHLVGVIILWCITRCHMHRQWKEWKWRWGIGPSRGICRKQLRQRFHGGSPGSWGKQCIS